LSSCVETWLCILDVYAFLFVQVVAGQGTVAMELLEQNPYMDAVIVPVGGGGLIAGMALLLKSINPRIKIYGVETKAMPGMYRSLKAGKLESVPKKPSMADGIAIEHVGAIAFDIIRDHVDEIVLVDEDEVAQAVLLMLEKEKTVTEGSGAAGLAALMANKLPQVAGQNVVCVATGSNIDMSLLQRIIEKGLVMSGRLARIHVTVLDIPGQLARVLNILRDLRANVKDIEHERAFLLGNVGTTQPIIEMETRDFEHVREIVETLKREGFESTYLATPVP
jgi:threonine dehydratase